MSNTLKDFIKSGKTLITDTKLRRADPIKPKDKAKPEELGDPHRIFIRKCIQDKPKKHEIIEEFKKFIKVEEDKL